MAGRRVVMLLAAFGAIVSLVAALQPNAPAATPRAAGASAIERGRPLSGRVWRLQ
jgi:hypothetical protein